MCKRSVKICRSYIPKLTTNWSIDVPMKVLMICNQGPVSQNLSPVPNDSLCLI